MRQFEKWDFVTLGRMAGLAIITVGFALAAWDVIEAEDDFGLGKARLFRTFLSQALSWLQAGVIVILVAEIAARLGPNWFEPDYDEEESQAESDEVAPPDPDIT